MSGPSQPKVTDEVWDDERVKRFLDLQPSGEDADFHVLVKAYRGMRPEDFERFLGFFRGNLRSPGKPRPGRHHRHRPRRDDRKRQGGRTMSDSRHRIRLSMKVITAAKPRAKEYTLWDNLLAHFGVRVQPSGVSRPYIVQTRVNGRMRKITLERFPELPFDAASAERPGAGCKGRWAPRVRRSAACRARIARPRDRARCRRPLTTPSTDRRP